MQEEERDQAAAQVGLPCYADCQHVAAQCKAAMRASCSTGMTRSLLEKHDDYLVERVSKLPLIAARLTLLPGIM